jgi:hypothetical protein
MTFSLPFGYRLPGDFSESNRCQLFRVLPVSFQAQSYRSHVPEMSCSFDPLPICKNGKISFGMITDDTGLHCYQSNNTQINYRPIDHEIAPQVMIEGTISDC